MKDFWFKTVPAFLKSKAFIWGLMAFLVIAIIAVFLHAWLGYAPNGGHPMPEPWKDQGSDFKKNPR